MIPYGRQCIDDEDIRSVVEVLRSDFLTQGPAIPAFEKAMADYCGAAHAVAVSNATAALHLACLALGVGAGDRVWTSPNTFVASANCALYCGAAIDFVDIDPLTYNMNPERLAEKLEKAERDGCLPKVVIPVHFAGQSCDMAAIHALSLRYGFRVLEDASHAVGASYRGTRVGDCRFSDIAVFSFHPVKIITTGEGGMALTNDPELARRIAMLRTHGVTRDEAVMKEASDGAWYYEQLALGFNCRLTDIQAALGTSQLRRLDEFLERRQALAAAYDDGFASEPVELPWQHSDAQSSWHLYVIRLRGADEAAHRAAFETLRALGIGVNLHYIPVYLHPYYRRLGFEPGHCPEAEAYYREALTLPLHPGLTDGDQQKVIDAVKGIIRT
jgi:UDP-4-amino-4,6-dideoxy-N-acetyl-beta-L-altrosamine transaminase